MLKVFKIIIILFLGLALFYLGCEAGYQAKYRLELLKNYRELEKFNQAIIDMFKADTYGGKTPEETFNMFIEALKNEDVDSAVKYIILDPDRRTNFWEEFNDLKQKGELKEYADWFPQWSEWEIIKEDENNMIIEFEWVLDESETVMWPDGTGGYIETVLPPGHYARSIYFAKNSNGVWKIENL